MGGHGGSRGGAGLSESDRLDRGIKGEIARSLGVKLQGGNKQVIEFKGKAFRIEVGDKNYDPNVTFSGRDSRQKSSTTVTLVSHGPFGREERQFDLSNPSVFKNIKRYVKS